MLSLSPVLYRPLSSSTSYEASMADDICTVKDENENILKLTCTSVNERLYLDIIKNDFFVNDTALLTAVEYLLGHHSELKRVELTGNIRAHDSIVLKYFSEGEKVSFSRSAFFQLKTPWHKDHDYVSAIEEWTTSADGRLHPKRPDIQKGIIYRRYVPEIGKTLSFRMIDADSDLDTFHNWHNQPRVANFWELALPKEELKQYIEKGLSDPHTLPMIAECDGIPVGYFELYWTREDRLAPYYESEMFDRGFHFLIGNSNFLGLKNTNAIIVSLTHFLFIDEIRTRRLMAEPRADNSKVLRYVESTGWKKLYEFDFPHKRAALLECRRESFFMRDLI